MRTKGSKNYQYDQALADKVNKFKTRKDIGVALGVSRQAVENLIRNLRYKGFLVTITDGRRGFAAMTKDERCKIASMGGKAVPPEKRAFSLDNELARSAGKKGGEK